MGTEYNTIQSRFSRCFRGGSASCIKAMWANGSFGPCQRRAVDNVAFLEYKSDVLCTCQKLGISLNETLKSEARLREMLHSYHRRHPTLGSAQDISETTNVAPGREGGRRSVVVGQPTQLT